MALRLVVATFALLFLGESFAQSEYPSDSHYNKTNEETRALQSSSGAAAGDVAAKETTKNVNDKVEVCHSHENFKAAFEYLIADKDLQLSQVKSLELALKISEGCDGAAARFIKIYQTLKKSGVAISKALEVGLSFSSLDDERAKNFMAVFQKLFLENYYDFDFPTAYHVSFELSRDLKGDIQQVREDFIRIVGFCMNNKKMGLPIRLCSNISLEIARLSPLFAPAGVANDFEQCYEFLRTNQNTGLSQAQALTLLPKILKHGPQACTNFKESFAYATKGEKLHLPARQALNLGLRLASQSMPEEKSKNENK